jgi:TonB family protein
MLTMKIGIAPLVLCLLLTSSVAAQKKKTDREHDGFFGPVHTIIEEGAALIGTPDKPIEGARYRLESRTYDLNGNLIEKIVYGGVGGKEVIDRAVYSSDSEGNRIENSYTGGSGIPDPSASQPPPVKEDRGPDGSYLYRHVFRYDDKGNRIEESVYRGGGAFVYKVEYEYNGNGQLVKRQTKQSDGTINKVSYSYLNAVITPLAETRNNGEKVKYDYGLDQQGNWVLRLAFIDHKKGGEKSTRTITYYENVGTERGARADGPPRDLVKPVAISWSSPRYSEEARKNQVQGVVILRVLVGEDGLVKQAIVTKGLPDGLNDEAFIAASRLKFRPALVDGKPTPYWQAVMIEFNLKFDK